MCDELSLHKIFADLRSGVKHIFPKDDVNVAIKIASHKVPVHS